jgi:hypothetical protein
MGYWMLYTQYIDCGKVDEATQCLNELKNYLNAIGCECNCTDCDDNTSNAPKEIYPLFSDPQPNYIPISYLEIDDIVTDSNTKVPSNKAVITYVAELLTNYYTEAEINALLANYYTKTEITFLLNNYYSKAEINAFLLNYYTKVQSDARYIPIYADNPQSGIDNNNLSGYISLNANNAPIIPGQIGLFSFINNKVASTDLVIIQIKDQSLIPGSYYTLIDVTARNGSVDFSCILNGASSVDDPITFQFIVCKGQ